MLSRLTSMVTGQPAPPRPIAVPRHPRNAPKVPKSEVKRTYSGFTPGIIFGILFLLSFLSLLCVELARLFNGSMNRNPITSYGLYPGNVYYPPYYNVPVGFNVERRQQYMWPWSSPVFMFIIPVFLASLFGFTSYCRGTYSMIYLLFTFSLISFFLTPFLIGYFSVDINRHNSLATAWRSNFNANVDRSCAIVLLILSLLLLPLALIAAIVSGLGYACCKTKGGAYFTPPRRYGYYNPAMIPTRPVPVVYPL